MFIIIQVILGLVGCNMLHLIPWMEETKTIYSIPQKKQFLKQMQTKPIVFVILLLTQLTIRMLFLLTVILPKVQTMLLFIMQIKLEEAGIRKWKWMESHVPIIVEIAPSLLMLKISLLLLGAI